MLHNKDKILQNPRLCKAIFGMSREEILRLLPLFSQCLLAYRYELHPHRKRKVGGGRKGDLPTDLDKLLYILMYLKIYSTYDVFSVLSEHQRSKCGDSVQLLLPVLERTLGRKLVLPARKATSLEEVFEKIPELKDVFLDGTERRVQRPKNTKKQRKLYSGKKKATTRKNILLTTEKKRILFLSKTKSGRRHDKRITDKHHLISVIPEDVTVWTDTGFQGIQHQHANTMMPQKATKRKPLTFAQKQNNRLIAGIRVIVEHAIAGWKRFQAVSDIYRNRLPNFDDRMNMVCAGLWNFHLEQA